MSADISNFFLTFFLVLCIVGQGDSVPIPPHQSLCVQTSQSRCGSVADYHLNIFPANHGVLVKRDTPAYPVTFAYNSPTSNVPEEKPALFKTIAQGLSRFFRVVKNWFKSDNKKETFKELGRRFSSWCRGMKERILQIRSSINPSVESAENLDQAKERLSQVQLDQLPSLLSTEGTITPSEQQDQGTVQGDRDLETVQNLISQAPVRDGRPPPEQNNDNNSPITSIEPKVLDSRKKQEIDDERRKKKQMAITAWKGAAEDVAKHLDSEYDGLFDSDEAQQENNNGLDFMVDKDYERLQAAGSGYASPINSESGPPRGLAHYTPPRIKNSRQKLLDKGIRNWLIPNWDSGERADPNELSATDAVLIEQGVDPTKLSARDRRNYAIILEWYKMTKSNRDVTHPQHHELYYADPHPPPDKDGYRMIWGTDAYWSQKDDPAPIPGLREKNKEMGFLEKLVSWIQFGLYSNDPNRPPMWYHNVFPGLRSTSELEDWIESHIPEHFIKKNFPAPDGRRTKQYVKDGLTDADRLKFTNILNENYREMARHRNIERAKILRNMAVQEVTNEAYLKGENQMKASQEYPSVETIASDKELFNKLKNKFFSNEIKYDMLTSWKRLHDHEVERLNSRLQNSGVHVVE